MSTSLLYHAFGIRGYQYTRTDYQDGQVIFTIHQDYSTCRCSSCGSLQVIGRGQVVRRFRALPIGGRHRRHALRALRADEVEHRLSRPRLVRV